MQDDIVSSTQNRKVMQMKGFLESPRHQEVDSIGQKLGTLPFTLEHSISKEINKLFNSRPAALYTSILLVIYGISMTNTPNLEGDKYISP